MVTMSGRGASSEHRRSPLSVSEWIIRSFQKTFDRRLASSADYLRYLLPALRLACAIADEICKVKEETGRSPTPRFDWADSIIVYVKSNRPTEDGTENVFDNILGDSCEDVRVELLPSFFDEKANDDDAITEDGTLYSLGVLFYDCLLYTSPSPRDQRGSRMPSSA